FVNPAVENVFEMGSIMKPLTLAAAFDAGKIKPGTIYDDKGYVMFGSARISNYDNKARGVVDMQKVLNESLNTGAMFAMEKLGKDEFSEYMVNYGFNEKTGIDLPNEVKSKISNIIKGKRDVEYATASFGQGVAITPIAMVSALASLANGGFIMRPYVVKEIKIKGLKNKKTEPLIKRQVLKKETSEEIGRMLANVVDSALLEGKYKLEHYTVAAKTGTAQVIKEGGGYYDDQYLHTFFGYAPAFDAKFLTFLFIMKPQGVRYASYSLTIPFMNITKFLLNYYEVPPDR
ncbi:MAG: penicillin-binding transpeptidase domain-containing protein, partial [Patescibacteria group bacterium]